MFDELTDDYPAPGQATADLNGLSGTRRIGTPLIQSSVGRLGQGGREPGRVAPVHHPQSQDRPDTDSEVIG
jgi:hypothetical protein